ncbi:MBL fold metallo-hydrolase [Spirilliplanes yamanashiensis]|nr:MBL fold metallo-hydrolase [Spirilliplanes yamanashiensis]MDP9817449.1 glyoxylase-like metal-dependent hydrolase (beta-lactamase superfamily II) [Spirilliplanes yamanashiensis]
MREVADGVVEVRIGYAHAHLIVVDDGVVLVDTGLPGRGHRIERALHGLRRQVGDVHTILLTHHHPDHTGGLADLRRRSGAAVVAHAADVPVVTGAERVTPTHPVVKLVGRIIGAAEPAPVDDVLTADGPTRVDGITAIHTPGHTAGHVSYLLDRSGGVLFAGDAAAGGRRRLGSTPAMVTADHAAARRSVARLAELDFDTAVFGHGPAVRGRAVDRFREYAARA